MSALRVHLWKEWREHRAALLGILVVMPFLLAGLAFFTPGQVRALPWYQATSVMLVVTATLLAVGGELLSAERKDGRLRWLERLPGGLAAAFRAKQVFFALTTLGALLYGILVARLLMVGGHEARVFEPNSFDLLLVGAYGALALWTFATSAWAPRGGLAIPLAALVLALQACPIALLLQNGYQTPLWEPVALGTLYLVAASLSASRAFVAGSRLGRSRWQASAQGLAIVALSLVPTWGWTGLRFLQRSQVDPTSDGFMFEIDQVTDDGSVVFGTAYQDSPSWEDPSRFLLRIDLETGAWRKIGQGGDHFAVFYETDPDDGHATARIRIDVMTDGGTLEEVFSIQTGEALEVAETDESETFYLDFDGHAQLLSDTEVDGPTMIYDPHLDRAFDREELGIDTYDEVHVTRGRWIVSSYEWNDDGEFIRGVDYLDPLTGDREPVDRPAEPWILSSRLGDGRALLYAYAENEDCAYWLCDPADGSLAAVEAPADLYLDADVYPTDDPFTPREGLFFRSYDSELYALDLDALELRLVLPEFDGHLYWHKGNDAIHMDSDGNIAHVDLETGEWSYLFPLSSE